MRSLIPTLILSISIFIISCNNKNAQMQQVNQDSVQKEEKRIRTILDQETQANLTAEQIVDQFKNGNERFLKEMDVHDDLMNQVKQTGKIGQFPKAVVLGCIDSRSPVSLIFDKSIGDAFTTNVAGNYVDDGVLGGMEFATSISGAKLIIVLGHTECGAIKGACDNVKLGNLTYVIDLLKPAVDSVKGFAEDRTSKNKKFVDAVTIENVKLTMNNIRRKSEIISGLEKEGKVKIIGAVYDVTTGKVNFLN